MNYQTFHDIAELVSLAGTLPTVVLAIFVVYTWGPAAWVAVRKGWPKMNGNDWFIVGVAIGFLGQIADNVFWAIPWTASYLRMESANSAWQIGVFFNIVFRQSMGIMAAYCHLRAAALADEFKVRRVNLIFGIGNLLGALFALVLVLTRTVILGS